MEQTEQTLLSELQQFVAELRKKKAAAKYTVPDEMMKAVRKAKGLEKFLYDIFDVVTGSGRIDIRGTIRREFGLSKELADHME